MPDYLFVRIPTSSRCQQHLLEDDVTLALDDLASDRPQMRFIAQSVCRLGRAGEVAARIEGADAWWHDDGQALLASYGIRVCGLLA
jgi:hypothetical protein